ncbi:hypothetical protein IV203_021205 [Nitzschia inconspicua]|uniref:Uncharacterized protein n=1 Tax=Nitzschia inconspicua TaxID=303405 RepID=A0A9K3KHG4_9STRA|nr:hypothetical protein IV203_021205 [Nitzschia inconspicua]
MKRTVYQIGYRKILTAGSMIVAALSQSVMFRKSPVIEVDAYVARSTTALSPNVAFRRQQRRLVSVSPTISSLIRIRPLPRLTNRSFLPKSTTTNNLSINENYSNIQTQHDHPLIQIGTLIQDRLDENIGATIQNAGMAWLDKDWKGVTESLGQTATALTDFTRTDTRGDCDLHPLWRLVAQELEDISTIEGCSSVGPPASIPNWLAIQDGLRSTASPTSKDARWMEMAATEIDNLIDSN